LPAARATAWEPPAPWLEASGHIRREPAPSDKRASIVQLTDSGRALVSQIKQLWCALPDGTVAEPPGVLRTLSSNVDTRGTRRARRTDAI
jgi:DNA-binding MarR family transcriptional regulator